MNSLEQKFFDAMDDEFRQYFSEEQAEVAAKIAIELAREAYNDGWSQGLIVGTKRLTLTFNTWLEGFILEESRLNSGKDNFEQEKNIL